MQLAHQHQPRPRFDHDYTHPRQQHHLHTRRLRTPTRPFKLIAQFVRPNTCVAQGPINERPGRYVLDLTRD
jgi:hypothetical protein